jgi:hypothetical protein
MKQHVALETRFGSQQRGWQDLNLSLGVCITTRWSVNHLRYTVTYVETQLW